MANYNFKEFFDDTTFKLLHDDEYLCNGAFIIKKTELKKSQLEYVNTFPMDESRIKSILSMVTDASREESITVFNPDLLGVIPKGGYILKDYNIVIMSFNNNHYAIKEEYYNFFNSLKCTIHLLSRVFAIHNKDNEFVGMLMPVKTKPEYIDKAVSYQEYLNKIQEAKKQKENRIMKKCLYISNNKAVIRNKQVACIADLINNEEYRNLYVEENTQEYGKVFIDLGIILMGTGRTIDRKTNSEGIEYSLSYLKTITLESYKNYITKCLENMQFINVAEIKLMEIAGESEEYIQTLINHRQKVLDLREQKHKEQEEKREQENQAYVAEQNKKAEDIINNAEQAIINKQNVANEDITIYKSKYESSTTSLILYLMKKYDINVPLKVQGWINKALANIVYDAEYDDYSYQYYKSSADSKVFARYLYQLVYKIKEKYGIITEAS